MNYNLEYGGGLGDIFHQMFSGGSFGVLNAMQPADRATVVLITHNPHARELFVHHAKTNQIQVRDLGYWLPEQDSTMRAKPGLPFDKPGLPCSDHSIEFFPSPHDLALLNELRGRTYVVFSVSAGLPGRNIPVGSVNELVRRAQDHSLLPVFVGRNYDRMGRKEYRPGNGALDFCMFARELPNVVCIHAKSAELNYDALKSPGFILIDGDHSFDGVKADSERAIAHLASHAGGMVVWYDYYEGGPQLVGVKKYVDSLDLPVEHTEGTWLAQARIKGKRNAA